MLSTFILAAIIGFSTPTPELIKAEIEVQAQRYGVDPFEAKQIAFCESSFRHDAKNPNSTATGVYQFTAPTWKWIKAEGERTDYQKNIEMFMRYYPKYPQWWRDCLPKSLASK